MLPVCHDPIATADPEMIEHAGSTARFGAIGKAFGPAASMIDGQAESACRHRAILLATLGR
jgi:hypothetical protein